MTLQLEFEVKRYNSKNLNLISVDILSSQNSIPELIEESIKWTQKVFSNIFNAFFSCLRLLRLLRYFKVKDIKF